MAICLHIHFRNNFTQWSDYAATVEYLNKSKDLLIKAFNLSEEQIDVFSTPDEEMEEDMNDMGRYGLRIEDPLWITCYLQDGFWAISTCEPYSTFFDDECNTRKFVEKTVRVLGGYTAYVTEEMAGWMELGEPDMTFEQWLEILQSPLISGFYRPDYTILNGD